MRELTLIVLIGLVTFLALINQLFLALLLGVAGALAIIMSSPGGKSFEPVEVPPAGDYPGWDFWKKTLEDLGTFAGGVLKSTTKVDKAIDLWGDYWKKKVWKAPSSTEEWIIPGYLQKIDKREYLVWQLMAPIVQAQAMLQNMYATAGPEERKRIARTFVKLERLKAKAIGMLKEKTEDFTKEYQKVLDDVEKILEEEGLG